MRPDEKGPHEEVYPGPRGHSQTPFPDPEGVHPGPEDPFMGRRPLSPPPAADTGPEGHLRPTKPPKNPPPSSLPDRTWGSANYNWDRGIVNSTIGGHWGCHLHDRG